MSDLLRGECTRRLGRALARERAAFAAQMIAAARRVSPLYFFLPPVLLRVRAAEATAAVLDTLNMADYRPLRDYLIRTTHYAHRLGRSPVLAYTLGLAWRDLVCALAAREFAAEPALYAEAVALMDRYTQDGLAIIAAEYGLTVPTLQAQMSTAAGDKR